MVSKLLTAIAIVSVATVLSVGGFTGFLVGSGRLNGPRVDLIASVLRGELDHWQPDAESATSQPAAASQPATEPVPAERGEMSDAKGHTTLEMLRLDRERSDVDARRRLLDQVLKDVVVREEQLEKKQKDLTELKEKSTAAANDEGFQKELDYVSSLKPALAKEHLVRVWKQSKADAVRLMVNIDEGRGKRVLEQFKTPEEFQIMTDLLEQIRNQGVTAYAGKSGTTNGQSPTSSP